VPPPQIFCTTCSFNIHYLGLLIPGFRSIHIHKLCYFLIWLVKCQNSLTCSLWRQLWILASMCLFCLIDTRLKWILSDFCWSMSVCRGTAGLLKSLLSLFAQSAHTSRYEWNSGLQWKPTISIFSPRSHLDDTLPYLSLCWFLYHTFRWYYKCRKFSITWTMRDQWLLCWLLPVNLWIVWALWCWYLSNTNTRRSIDNCWRFILFYCFFNTDNVTVLLPENVTP